MKDRGFRRRMQFNIKEREYEHVLTASSVCIDTSFLFSDKPNCTNVVKKSKKEKRKKEKSKIGLE